MLYQLVSLVSHLVLVALPFVLIVGYGGGWHLEFISPLWKTEWFPRIQWLIFNWLKEKKQNTEIYFDQLPWKVERLRMFKALWGSPTSHRPCVGQPFPFRRFRSLGIRLMLCCEIPRLFWGKCNRSWHRSNGRRFVRCILVKGLMTGEWQGFPILVFKCF